MLAVRSPMDALQRSTSLGGQKDSLLRQPSAEDLDAAHQLVSSARGERHGSHVTHEPHPSDTSPDQSYLRRISPSQDAMDIVRISGESSDQAEDPSGLGQMCRYVGRPIPSWFFVFYARIGLSFHHVSIMYRVTLLMGSIVTVEPLKRLCGDDHQPATQYAMPVGSTKRHGTLHDLPTSNVPTLSLQLTVRIRRQVHHLSLLPLLHRHPNYHSQASRTECLNIHQDPALVEGVVMELAVLKAVEGALRTTTESRGQLMFRQSSIHRQTQKVTLTVQPDPSRGQSHPPQLNRHHRVKPIPQWLLHAKTAGLL